MFSGFRINLFAEATCDEQWTLLEKELPNGKTDAHGLLSLALAPGTVALNR